MGADNDLIPFPKQPLGKFQPDRLFLLWCNLPRLNGLEIVLAEEAAHFAKLLFGFHYFRKSGVHAAAI